MSTTPTKSTVSEEWKSLNTRDKITSIFLIICAFLCGLPLITAHKKARIAIREARIQKLMTHELEEHDGNIFTWKEVWKERKEPISREQAEKLYST